MGLMQYRRRILNNAPHLETASGAIATFDTDIAAPLKECKISFLPVQSGSGDPSPDNIRPISGWTELNAHVCGKNIWNEEWEAGGIDRATGEPVYQGLRIRSKNFIPVKPNTSYYFSCELQMWVSIYMYDANKSYVRNIDPNVNNVFTTDANIKYIKFNSSGAYGETYNHNISINYPSTDTNYHPYTGRNVSVDWQNEAGTVYGGTRDLISGKLIANMGIVDLGTLDWAVGSGASSPSGKLFQTISNIAKPRERFTPNNVICTIYATADQNVWFTSNYSDLTVGIGNTGRIIVRDDRYDNNVVAFKSAISGVQLVYELATPITYHLTPLQLNALKGTNNIFADTNGEVTVGFWTH